ncbi:MAG: 5,6-dimethylbenzimidazole synthase [Candidatus Rokubacteria bacterium]|nr:5,6-dimethylbenzimidazole synthase [Candidatus Rokubacteria bacterium]
MVPAKGKGSRLPRADFPDAVRKGIYNVIFGRRDVRAQFTGGSIPETTLTRILTAAHYAPSVGFAQPWDFIIVRSLEIRQKVREAFERAHAAEAAAMPPTKRRGYLKFKLEGILESSINVCVTCDRKRFKEIPVGRSVQPQMDLYSVVCAVENLWLAARAEGIGVGWVSIVRLGELKAILRIPKDVAIVAYLCVGPVTHFAKRPELEQAGWLPRLPLERLVHLDRWGAHLNGQWPALTRTLCAQARKESGKGQA